MIVDITKESMCVLCYEVDAEEMSFMELTHIEFHAWVYQSDTVKYISSD